MIAIRNTYGQLLNPGLLSNDLFLYSTCSCRTILNSRSLSSCRLSSVGDSFETFTLMMLTGSGDIEPKPSSEDSADNVGKMISVFLFFGGSSPPPPPPPLPPFVAPSCWLTSRFSWQFCDKSLVFSCSKE